MCPCGRTHEIPPRTERESLLHPRVCAQAAQAETHMASGDYEKAAASWLDTAAPFEEVCLKFIHAGAR